MLRKTLFLVQVLKAWEPLVDYPEGLRKYEGYLVSTGTPLEGMKVALDTANGAASTSARQIFCRSWCSINCYWGNTRWS